MNDFRKIALFNLSLSSTALILQLPKLISDSLSVHFVSSILGVILSCFIAALYFFRHQLTRQGGKYFDERDKSIHKKAALIGFATSFFVLFLAIIITYLVFNKGDSISILSLLGIFMLSAMSLFFAESIAILVQYYWGSDNG